MLNNLWDGWKNLVSEIGGQKRKGTKRKVPKDNQPEPQTVPFKRKHLPKPQKPVKPQKDQ